jgi:hypothetical protein
VIPIYLLTIAIYISLQRASMGRLHQGRHISVPVLTLYLQLHPYVPGEAAKPGCPTCRHCRDDLNFTYKHRPEPQVKSAVGRCTASPPKPARRQASCARHMHRKGAWLLVGATRLSCAPAPIQAPCPVSRCLHRVGPTK